MIIFWMDDAVNKFMKLHWCAEGYTNNWRKLHHYPMRRKYNNNYTYPCDILRKKGLCDLPFCYEGEKIKHECYSSSS